MNKVILLGRLTRDPQIYYSQGENQTAMAKYCLAVQRRFKRDNDVACDFINCVAFGKQAEHAERYYRQGLKIVVCGRIQTGSYTNKEGAKVYTTDVIVEEQDFAESKSAAAQNNIQAGPSPYGSEPDADGFMYIPNDIDDEVPFK